MTWTLVWRWSARRLEQMIQAQVPRAPKADHHGVDTSPGERRDSIGRGLSRRRAVVQLCRRPDDPGGADQGRGPHRALRGPLFLVLGDGAGAINDGIEEV